MPEIELVADVIAAQKHGHKPAVLVRELLPVQAGIGKAGAGEIEKLPAGIAGPSVLQAAEDHPQAAVQNHDVGPLRRAVQTEKPPDQQAAGLLPLPGGQLIDVDLLGAVPELDKAQFLRLALGVKAAACGVDQRAAAVIDCKIVPIPAQVTAQGVVVSRRERGTLQQSIPVRRLVQAVQPGVPQGKHHGGHGQQRQGEEQVVARQQGKKAPAYALIFQACTPVLSL